MVTWVPGHILFGPPPIITAGTTTGLTVMATAFDVAVAGDAHERDDVIMHVTTSP
jgi:hypothetical protein